LARHGGVRAFADARLGRDEVRQKRNVVVTRPWLEGLRGASEQNYRACLGGFTETRRIGLAHLCIAFFGPHSDTVSIPDRTNSSYIAWARRVPPGVNRPDTQKAHHFSDW
jgi:hypothetical protein